MCQGSTERTVVAAHSKGAFRAERTGLPSGLDVGVREGEEERKTPGCLRR